MTDKIDISEEAVARLLDGVTPGPWRVPGQPDKICVDGYTKNGFAKTIATAASPSWIGGTEPSANADFIAAARDLVPALRAALTAAEADRDAMRAENARLCEALREATSSLDAISGNSPSKGSRVVANAAANRARAALKGSSHE